MVRNKRLKSENAARRIRKVTRLLWVAFGGGILASFIFLIAMSTTGWMSMELPSGTFRNSTRAYLIRQYAGLWKKCWVEWENFSTPAIQREYCRMKKFFPSKAIVDSDDEIDYGLLDYTRSEAAFSVISLLLSAIPNFFTWYSIQEPRYMFKRVAGALHLITAGCIVVCIEVFKTSMDYEKRNLPARYPTNAVLTFGYAVYLAWVSFALFLLIGITMFVLSAKKKGEKAISEREAFENEPVIIGRT